MDGEPRTWRNSVWIPIVAVSVLLFGLLLTPPNEYIMLVGALISFFYKKPEKSDTKKSKTPAGLDSIEDQPGDLYLDDLFPGEDSEEIADDSVETGSANPYKRRSIPTAVKQEVWYRDEGKCVLCGSRANLQYDHEIPVSKGGGYTVENIRLLCAPCNGAKGDRIE
jgi:hypothetical protein